jgi:hypothetical protein
VAEPLNKSNNNREGGKMKSFFSSLAAGSLALMSSGSAFESPAFTGLEQNTRTVEWAPVTRITVGQKSSRKIRITGPWMDYISAVNANGGVSGRNIDHVGDRQSTIILDAAESAPRGTKNISVSIACPFGGNLLGCTSGPVPIPIRVFETGPITSISPSGTVTPNTPTTFELQGQALDVAVLLPRLLTLKNATILSKSATSMQVRGTTPACGYIDVALTDQADGSEFPYRKGSQLQAVLAGHICGTTLAPPAPVYHYCPPGQNWNPSTNSCQSP